MTKKSRDRREYPLNCSGGSKTNTNPGTYPTSYTTKDEDHNGPAPSTCPDYFRWIHKDLRPWVHTGITREMIERGREPGYFRLVMDLWQKERLTWRDLKSRFSQKTPLRCGGSYSC